MQKAAATNPRTFHTFLLMAQLEAREIGARIQRARLESGLTQEQLAEMASFSKRSLQDYETGVTIPYRHLRELSKLLGREPEWFLYGEPDPPAEEPDSAVEARLDHIERVQEEQVALLRQLVSRLRQAGEEPPP